VGSVPPALGFIAGTYSIVVEDCVTAGDVARNRLITRYVLGTIAHRDTSTHGAFLTHDTFAVFKAGPVSVLGIAWRIDPAHLEAHLSARLRFTMALPVYSIWAYDMLLA